MFHKGRKSCAEKKTEHIGSSSCLYGKESDEAPVLSYNDVSVCYGEKTVLSDVSFLVKPGEILGIVGESGSGKSTIIRAALGILGNGGTVAGGTIDLNPVTKTALQRFLVGLRDDAAGKSHLDGLREPLLHKAYAADLAGEAHLAEDRSFYGVEDKRWE